MNKLNNWDFANPTLNETVQQINRQKSALNQELVFLDRGEKLAVFNDPYDGRNIATLESCTCRDFNFAGSGVRKKFFPCKHIYRLCFELGVMQVKHYDFKTRMRMMSSEEKREWTLDKMRSYPADTTKWGNWNEKVHRHFSQALRQIRAYEILDLYPDQAVRSKENVINGYDTHLTNCSCPDFSDRKLPCKHIYVQAILGGYELPVSKKDYENSKTVALDVVHRFVPTE